MATCIYIDECRYYKQLLYFYRLNKSSLKCRWMIFVEVPLAFSLAYHERMTFIIQELSEEFADIMLNTHDSGTIFDNITSCDSANEVSLVFLQSVDQSSQQALVIDATESVFNRSD